MAIRVIAQRRLLKIGKNPGVKKFVMRPDLYTPIQEKKVFAEASNHSGISAGVIKAAWGSSARGLPRATPSPCPDWEPCASVCVRRLSRTWRT